MGEMCWCGKLWLYACALSCPFPPCLCPWAPWGDAQKSHWCLRRHVKMLRPEISSVSPLVPELPLSVEVLSQGTCYNFELQGDFSELPFSQGLCLYPSRHIGSHRWWEQQQQSPWPSTQHPASSRQGAAGGMPCGPEACSSWEVQGTVVNG